MELVGCMNGTASTRVCAQMKVKGFVCVNVMVAKMPVSFNLATNYNLVGTLYECRKRR